MTAPSLPPDWDAIARYLAGESPADEAQAVRGWLDANPQDRELVARLDSAVSPDVVGAPAADVDVEGALAQVHQRMAEPARPELRVVRGRGRWGKRIAAVTIVGAAAAAAIVMMTSRTRPTPSYTIGAHVYTTGAGQRDSVQLTDGSRIVIGPRSRLVVPGDYGSASRTVELTGNGFFDVRHDASSPFTVRAGAALVEDIGTTFIVESDSGHATSVSVMTGSVRLRAATSASSDGVVLAAGDRGGLDLSGQTHVERNGARTEDAAWVSGQLSFRDAALSRVAADIERWYGVHIRFTDSSLARQHVTMSFAGEQIDQVLKIVELSVGAKLERRGDTAIFSPNHGPAASR